MNFLDFGLLFFISGLIFGGIGAFIMAKIHNNNITPKNIVSFKL